MRAAISDVTAIFRDVLRDRDLELEPATRFDEVAGWDSMDLITVVVEVENRFGLVFDPAEIDRLMSIGDLSRMIEAKRAVAAA